MEKKEIYCVSYASFFDNEVYTETLGVFPTLEEAQSFLAAQFKSVIDDDFYGNEENLNIYRTDSEFSVDNDDTYIAMKVQRKRY